MIGSSLLTSSPFNNSDAPTLLHCSSGSRSSPDISFAPSSLALSCSWEMLQDLGSDHLPILLTVALSPVSRLNECLPFFNFEKVRWDDFAFYFDSHCPSAKEYSSLSSAAALFTSLTLNAFLTIWCSGLTALFLFFLARAALASLPTALSVALRPPFSFQQAQYAQVFPLKPAPFCTLFVGLGSTNKSAIFLLFSYYLALVLSSPPSFLLPQSLWHIWQELSSLSPPVLSGCNGSPDTGFSQETMQLISWPDGERYSCPPQSLVVSYPSYPLLSFRRLEAYCLIEVF